MTVRVSWDGLEIAGPCAAGPLRRETSVLEVRDGLLSPWLVQMVPDLTRCPAITLDRPLGADRAFLAWAAQVAPFPVGPVPEPPDFRKEVTLEFTGVGVLPRYRLVAAWPAAYEVLDQPDGLARERLTLVHEGFERLDDAVA